MNEIQPAKDFSLSQIEELESRLIDMPQVDVPLTQRFAPGCYYREVDMPTGSFIIGHLHKTEHLNVILTGKVKVLMQGALHTIEAPAVFVSKPGVRKILFIEERCRWATIHPTEETDEEKLAELLDGKRRSEIACAFGVSQGTITRETKLRSFGVFYWRKRHE